MTTNKGTVTSITTPIRISQLDARVTMLEQLQRQATASIRALSWSLVVITFALAVAITCIGLFATGYLPR